MWIGGSLDCRIPTSGKVPKQNQDRNNCAYKSTRVDKEPNKCMKKNESPNIYVYMARISTNAESPGRVFLRQLVTNELDIGLGRNL